MTNDCNCPLTVGAKYEAGLRIELSLIPAFADWYGGNLPPYVITSEQLNFVYDVIEDSLASG